MVRVGIIGFGYWGPNLLRNFEQSSAAKTVAVSDLCAERLTTASKGRPTLKTTGDARELISSPDIDAVVIATPMLSHFDLALEALRNGKHVLVEKPLCSSSEQASRLIEESVRRGLALMVDHTFVYSGAVRALKKIVDSGSLGDLYYYDSVRVNLGLVRKDINVVWDLASHDFSIVDFLLHLQPLEVSAVGVGHVRAGLEDIAYITAFFEDSFVAHIGVNWLAPVKIRTTLLGGSQKMIVYDDLEVSEKIKVYDKGVILEGASSFDKMQEFRIGYRTGDMHAPHIDRTEPLQRMVEEFLDCIATSRQPLSDGESGLRVIRILEAASASIRRRGVPVPVKP